MNTKPSSDAVKSAVSDGLAAAEASRALRKTFRRRRTPQRDRKLRSMRSRCSEAADPLRSYIGMVLWHDIPLADELAMKDAIAKLRYERRQIDKML